MAVPLNQEIGWKISSTQARLLWVGQHFTDGLIKKKIITQLKTMPESPEESMRELTPLTLSWTLTQLIQLMIQFSLCQAHVTLHAPRTQAVWLHSIKKQSQRLWERLCSERGFSGISENDNHWPNMIKKWSSIIHISTKKEGIWLFRVSEIIH